MRVPVRHTLVSLAIVTLGTVLGAIFVPVFPLIVVQAVAPNLRLPPSADIAVTLTCIIAGALTGAYLASLATASIRQQLLARHPKRELPGDSSAIWLDRRDEETDAA